MKHLKYILIIALLSVISCNKYLDIEPVGKVIPKSVGDYRSFLTEAYSMLIVNKPLLAYRADELVLVKNTNNTLYYKDIYIWNDDNPDPSTNNYPYAQFYKTIFHVNQIIDESDNIAGNLEDKHQLVGEAYAFRAFQYFQLINLYAKHYNSSTSKSDRGVPIVTTYDSNQEFRPKSVSEVYDLILSDIDNAEQRLNVDKQNTGYNYRFSKVALKGFKTRVYLYQKQWQKAIEAANEALAIQSSIVDLNVNNNKMPSEYDTPESILALEPVSSYFISVDTYASDALLGAYDTTHDLRFPLYFNLNNGHYLIRKNANNKYYCSIRTSDLYLIKSEAYAELNKLNEAKQELIDFTKNRYTAEGWNNLKNQINDMDKTALIAEILKERQREFAIEGHRWFDLKRTTQPKITKTYDSQTYVLEQQDGRYVIPFPKLARVNNPLLNQ